MMIAMWWSSCFIIYFTRQSNFVPLLDLSEFWCLKMLYRIIWQDWPSFWQDWQKFCPRFLGLVVIKGFARFFSLSGNLAQLWPHFSIVGGIPFPLVIILFVGVPISCSWAQHWLKVPEIILGSWALYGTYLMFRYLACVTHPHVWRTSVLAEKPLSEKKAHWRHTLLKKTCVQGKKCDSWKHKTSVRKRILS